MNDMSWPRLRAPYRYSADFAAGSSHPTVGTVKIGIKNIAGRLLNDLLLREGVLLSVYETLHEARHARQRQGFALDAEPRVFRRIQGDRHIGLPGKRRGPNPGILIC
jgi:hypothetical protein